jgi:uroporphyrin-3 C-methyltransferase
LVAANEEVQIRANPQLAIKALQQADARLKLLTDPRLIAVRQEIAREIAALNATPQPDVEGMAMTLNTLADSVDQLPLKRSAPEHYSPADASHNSKAGDQPQGLWDKLKASLSRLMSDMFTVHRSNAFAGPLLAPKEEFFLRRNLELRLDAARAALFDHDRKGFRDSVRAAQLWLDAYFDPQNNVVKAGSSQLASMEQQNIAPALPDISASLSLLRQLEAGRNSAP